MNALLEHWMDDHVRIFKQVEAISANVTQAAELLAHTLRDGGKLMFCGNGGSAADSQHLAAEFVGRFHDERPALPAIALTTDTSVLTCVANDYAFDEVFARQVRAHGRPGDVLMLLSTSGRSPNLVAAAEAGRSLGLTVWALTGPGPNPLADAASEALCLPGETPSVQEAHLVTVHLLCEMVDRSLASRVSAPARATQELVP